MALPSVQDLREYLRIESTVEDLLLERLLVQARAAVEAYIRQPIEARAVTVTLTPHAPAGTWGTSWASALGVSSAARMVFPLAPVASVVSVDTEDGDTLVADTDYEVNLATGRIVALSGGAGFTATPYTVTAIAGLSLRADYTDHVEPALSSAILDWAADLYQRRNPAASYESGGGGVAVNYNETASKTMPSRIRVTLDPWRRVLV
jgi:hypothetical protein